MIYFDNSATTFVSDAVKAKISELMEDQLSANPGALHKLGNRAFELYEGIRKETAGLLGAKPEEIFFTSCATESANTAIKGYMSRNKRAGNAVISTRTEHKATLECLEYLAKLGYEIRYVKVGLDGKPVMASLEEELGKGDVALACFTLVNNETGAVLPFADIAKKIKIMSPSTAIYLDCVQALGKMQIDLASMGADMCSFSGHKIHSVKGNGVLYVRKGVRIDPLIVGGGQQDGMRSGTQSPVLAGAFLEALKEVSSEIDEAREEVALINNYLRKELAARGAQILSPDDALPYVLNVSFRGFESETMLHCLEIYDIYVSTVSACSAKQKKVSYVLLEMGIDRKTAANAVRLSFSRHNTMDEAYEFIRHVDEIYEQFLIK
ncbi:cysteine desulfurase family protein [Butyrivibrio sp. AE2032]|uniref:cysteine desulfurase family protein n=1 Tax=Butyrivibrio sp. AE2032 TaxID=1458463 RepID=UPI00068FA22A|nr:cysteine desulfurase family protein [Butyrivibrio sp. AE2032]